MPLPLPQGTDTVLAHLADAASVLNAFLETARQGEFQPWLWLATSAVIQFLAVYLTSKILTHETSRLANALKVLARLWVGALCVAFLAGAGIWMGAAKESPGLMTASALLLPILLLGAARPGDDFAPPPAYADLRGAAGEGEFGRRAAGVE